jgi:hypothetical protein
MLEKWNIKESNFEKEFGIKGWAKNVNIKISKLKIGNDEF